VSENKEQKIKFTL